MRQHVELIWRLAVAAEAAERRGQSGQAEELRSRFKGAVERPPRSTYLSRQTRKSTRVGVNTGGPVAARRADEGRTPL
jgi:hypothetical protein